MPKGNRIWCIYNAELMSNGVRPHKRDASLLQKDYGNVHSAASRKCGFDKRGYRIQVGGMEIDGSEQWQWTWMLWRETQTWWNKQTLAINKHSTMQMMFQGEGGELWLKTPNCEEFPKLQCCYGHEFCDGIQSGHHQ